ncbi:tetratricopeptide repeat protein [Nostoc sp.]|uniref:tetratricopeptide repeat protein n=1 Tax=Nostoc sp. TaxID=1180 RepID=UPI002FF3C2E9
MSNFFGAISKFDYWLWICAIVGLVFVVVQPSYWLGWVFLNMFLYQLIAILIIIPHELGHAIATRFVGMKVIKIIIGSGRTLFTLQLLGILWEIKRFPTGGMTLISVKSTHFYRLKIFLITLCGPLSNFLLIFIALQLPQKVILNNPLGIYLYPGIIFYMVNTTMIVINLFPDYKYVDNIKIPSDGLQLLTLPFLSKEEIAQRVALSYVLDGLDWEHRGNYQQAIESFSEAILKNPTCVQAYQRLGNAYQAISDYQKAVDNFNQAIKLEPQNATSYFFRGFAYYHWQKIDSTKLQNVIEDISQAIHIEPKIEFFYYIRGASYSYIGDEVQAIEDFTKVIKLNSSTNSYYNRGVIYYQQNSYQDALEDFDRAINIDNKNISAYYGRGNVKYELQDKSGAFQDYDKAKSLSSSETIIPKDEHGFYARGIACVRLRNKIGAMKNFQIAEALCLEHGNAKLLQQIREEVKKISDGY